VGERKVRKRRLPGSQTVIDQELANLSTHQLKELLLITRYKLAFTRAQVETLTDIIVHNKLATHEEIWKKTNIHFRNVK